MLLGRVFQRVADEKVGVALETGVARDDGVDRGGKGIVHGVSGRAMSTGVRAAGYGRRRGDGGGNLAAGIAPVFDPRPRPDRRQHGPEQQLFAEGERDDILSS